MKDQLPRRGFTLIELLVVIAIIGVLLGLTAGAVQRVRDAAARTTCRNNLRQIGVALHHYHSVHRVLPPGCSYQKGKDPYPHISWCTRLMPYLEQEAVWTAAERAYAQEPSFLKPPHPQIYGLVMSALICPSDGRIQQPRTAGGQPRPAFTSFLGLEGTNQSTRDGLLFLDSRVGLADVADGTSNTLMVGERPPSASLTLGWWYAGWGQSQDGSGEMVLGVRERNVSGYYRTTCPPGPYEFGPGRFDDPCAAFHFWSPHSGGSHFLFADGSVRFLSYSMNPLMPALATRAGGETVSLSE